MADIKNDQQKLEKEIVSDKENIVTLKQRLENQEKLLNNHEALLKQKKALAEKRAQIEKVLQANDQEDSEQAEGQ